MKSRELAALLSSLVSELVLLILLLFPSSYPPSLTSSSDSSSDFNSGSYPNGSVLIRHFLFSQEIAASLSLLSYSRKRKRTESESEPIQHGRSEGVSGGPKFQLGLSRSLDSFKNSFKMTSSTFEWLSGLLEPLLECRDPVGLLPLKISAELRLGIGLFRLASGSNYSEISKQFGVSESVARFCVKQFCRVLCTNFRFWVTFPNLNDLKSVAEGFESLSGLPNCCGVIDCTRFEFINKDKFSENGVAAQIVVDSSSRILNIVAGFRGKNSDFQILKSSTLYKDIENGSLLNGPFVSVNGVAINQYLIGDIGYPLLPWLMVPFPETVVGSLEDNFNSAHNLLRLPALKTIASLKNWGVLSQPIHEELRMAVAYIGACSILHNILLMREDLSAFPGEIEDYPSRRQSFQCRGDTRLQDDSTVQSASIVRSILATKAKKD